MNASPRRIRVAVVFGGRSSEHAISCVTAGGIFKALDPAVFDVVPIGITKDGRWVLESADSERLAITDGRLPEVADSGDSVVLPPGRGLVVTSPGSVPRELGDVDVVFPVLHGPYGEDGTIQGLLEMADARYVGSGVLASAVAMDKHVTKHLLRAAGLPVARHVLVDAGPWEAQKARVAEEVAGLGWPVFVKPSRAGSSMGVTKVSGPADLDDAIAQARRHDPKVIVEEAMTGREIECGVLEGVAGGPPEASVIGEITVRGDHEFYDFDAKYLPDSGTDLIIPADIPAEATAAARTMALEAFTALGCESLARVDFFLRPDGSLVVNEVNTMPGFTPTSMFPLVWKASGLDYPALVDRLVRTALARPTGLR